MADGGGRCQRAAARYTYGRGRLSGGWLARRVADRYARANCRSASRSAGATASRPRLPAGGIDAVAVARGGCAHGVHKGATRLCVEAGGEPRLLRGQDGGSLRKQVGHGRADLERSVPGVGQRRQPEIDEAQQITDGHHGEPFADQGVVGVIPFRPLGVQPDAPVGHQVGQLGQEQHEELFDHGHMNARGRRRPAAAARRCRHGPRALR